MMFGPHRGNKRAEFSAEGLLPSAFRGLASLRRQRHFGASGTLMIELLVALGLASGVILVIAATFTQSARSAVYVGRQMQAAIVAENQLEALRHWSKERLDEVTGTRLRTEPEGLSDVSDGTCTVLVTNYADGVEDLKKVEVVVSRPYAWGQTREARLTSLLWTGMRSPRKASFRSTHPASAGSTGQKEEGRD